jgi:ribose 5-phosphate isomerase A
MAAHTPGGKHRMDKSQQDRWKKAAGEAAALLAENGMVVGLGTGSTAAFFVKALARRVAQERLRVVGIATSEETARLARSLKIPLTTFASHAQIDLTVDGADEVQLETLYLIKGRGGALLREKIVASASKRMIVIADETKLVQRLGSRVAVPVEIVKFGWQATQEKIRKLGGNPFMRMARGKRPFVTDGGNYVLDCAFGGMENPKETAHHLDHVVGAIEHGLFLGFTREVLVGEAGGVKVLKSGEKNG